MANSKKKKAVKKPVKKAVKKTVAKKTKPAKKTTPKKATAKPKRPSSVGRSPQKPATKAASKPALKKATAAPVQKSKPTPSVDYNKAITPLADRLVVKVTEGERVTAGGLIIPDSVSQAVGFLKAKVLATGHGAKNKKGQLRPLDVKVGDTVLFGQHAGTKIKFNQEELQIIHESDVMGIVQ